MKQKFQLLFISPSLKYWTKKNQHFHHKNFKKIPIIKCDPTNHMNIPTHLYIKSPPPPPQKKSQ